MHERPCTKETTGLAGKDVNRSSARIHKEVNSLGSIHSQGAFVVRPSPPLTAQPRHVAKLPRVGTDVGSTPHHTHTDTYRELVHMLRTRTLPN